MSNPINETKSWTDKVFTEGLSVTLSIIALIGMITTALLFIFYGNWKFSSVLDEEKVAQFGDFVGGVIGTILAFVAAILYYVALKAQRKDIAINQQSMTLQTEALKKQIEEFEKQKEELELSRKVYEQQSKTMAEQERTMRIQQFESSFYSLLNVYISIKNNLNTHAVGKDYFMDIYTELKSLYTNTNDHPYECHNAIVQSYETLFLNHQGQLSHYFKIIYRLIKIVETNVTLDKNEKIAYIKIIRSQFTDYELIITYYNCHSVYGGKSKDLIYKYNLLKHITTVDKIDYTKKYNIKSDRTELIPFYRFISMFIEKGINQMCSLEFIDECIEDEFTPLGCIVSIVNNGELRIDISFEDKMKCQNTSKEMFHDLIYDQLFLSQFTYIRDGILNTKFTEINNKKIVYSYVLNSSEIKEINIDKH